MLYYNCEKGFDRFILLHSYFHEFILYLENLPPQANVGSVLEYNVLFQLIANQFFLSVLRIENSNSIH